MVADRIIIIPIAVTVGVSILLAIDKGIVVTGLMNTQFRAAPPVTAVKQRSRAGVEKYGLSLLKLDKGE